MNFQHQNEKNPLFILVLLSEMFWSILAIFTACEFGEQLGSAFFEIDRGVVELDWYLFPIELWYWLPTVMVAAQEPIGIHAIGSVSCRRITFKNVSEVDDFEIDIFGIDWRSQSGLDSNARSDPETTSTANKESEQKKCFFFIFR